MSEPPKFKTFRDLKSVPSTPAKPVLEVVPAIEDNASSTSSTSTSTLPSISSKRSNTSRPRLSSSTSNTSRGETAVTKDFQKVPNSVTRNYLAEGIFKGKSKLVWDYLWSVSRGSINPSRVVRKSRAEIKRATGIGSFVTLDGAVKHLEDVGLLKKLELIGSHGGNEYEIFTPEEIASSTSNTSTSSNTSLTQKLDILVLPETRYTSESQTPINIGSNEGAKTLFKDNKNNDDEAFAEMISKLSATAEKLTGKKPSKNESNKWSSLADLLILELEVAAARAGGVSSVPAFLTEVLRRQFFAARQQQKVITKTSKTSALGTQVGKNDFENFEIKALDTQGRELALEELKEFAGESFLDDFKKWYTDEDWQWLTGKLKK